MGCKVVIESFVMKVKSLFSITEYWEKDILNFRAVYVSSSRVKVVLIIKACILQTGSVFIAKIFTCVVNHFCHCWDTQNDSSSFTFFFNLTPFGGFEVINPAWMSSYITEERSEIVSLFCSFHTLQIIQSAAILHEYNLLPFITPSPQRSL